jgi:hypothetical protein
MDPDFITIKTACAIVGGDKPSPSQPITQA